MEQVRDASFLSWTESRAAFGQMGGGEDCFKWRKSMLEDPEERELVDPQRQERRWSGEVGPDHTGPQRP